MSETGTAFELKPGAGLTPGWWEFLAEPPAGHYIRAISERSTLQPRRRVATGSESFEIFINQTPSQKLIRVQLGSDAASIEGRVTSRNGASAGASVFLWPVAENTRRAVGGTLHTTSAIDGGFRFESIPPGEYRALATFDAVEADEDLIEFSRAVTLKAGAGHTGNVGLTLWSAP